MSQDSHKKINELREQLHADIQRDRRERQKGYRYQALQLLPHICASCGRSFEGKNLRELTVHHKNGDYKHNPPDGSNWELLCLYCHDHEHEKFKVARHYEGTSESTGAPPATFQPFADLDGLIQDKS